MLYFVNPWFSSYQKVIHKTAESLIQMTKIKDKSAGLCDFRFHCGVTGEACKTCADYTEAQGVNEELPM